MASGDDTLNAEVKEKCDDIVAFRRAHGGREPRRGRRVPRKENTLGIALSKLKMRRHRALNAQPSGRMLTSREAEYLDWALSSSALCVGIAGAGIAGSEAGKDIETETPPLQGMRGALAPGRRALSAHPSQEVAPARKIARTTDVDGGASADTESDDETSGADGSTFDSWPAELGVGAGGGRFVALAWFLYFRRVQARSTRSRGRRSRGLGQNPSTLAVCPDIS